MNLNLPEEIAPLLTLMAAGAMLLTALIHIVFAVAVFNEGTSTLREGKTWLVPPAMWAIATLMGGVFVAGLFWVVHCSKISPRVP